MTGFLANTAYYLAVGVVNIEGLAGNPNQITVKIMPPEQPPDERQQDFGIFSHLISILALGTLAAGLIIYSIFR